MTKTMNQARESAARALCRHNKLPENTQFEGRPMWESFLLQVDVVLEAALSKEEWDQLKADEPVTPSESPDVKGSTIERR